MVVSASSFSLVSAHLAWTEITSFAFAAAERRGREDMICSLHSQMLVMLGMIGECWVYDFIWRGGLRERRITAVGIATVIWSVLPE
jgi:hypothetical protein